MNSIRIKLPVHQIALACAALSFSLNSTPANAQIINDEIDDCEIASVEEICDFSDVASVVAASADGNIAKYNLNSFLGRKQAVVSNIIKKDRNGHYSSKATFDYWRNKMDVQFDPRNDITYAALVGLMLKHNEIAFKNQPGNKAIADEHAAWLLDSYIAKVESYSKTNAPTIAALLFHIHGIMSLCAQYEHGCKSPEFNLTGQPSNHINSRIRNVLGDNQVRLARGAMGHTPNLYLLQASTRRLAKIAHVLADNEEIFDSYDPTGINYLKQRANHLFSTSATNSPDEFASMPYGDKNIFPFLVLARTEKFDISARKLFSAAYHASILQYATLWQRGHVVAVSERTYPFLETQAINLPLKKYLWTYFGGPLNSNELKSHVDSGLFEGLWPTLLHSNEHARFVGLPSNAMRIANMPVRSTTASIFNDPVRKAWKGTSHINLNNGFGAFSLTSNSQLASDQQSIPHTSIPPGFKFNSVAGKNSVLYMAQLGKDFSIRSEPNFGVGAGTYPSKSKLEGTVLANRSSQIWAHENNVVLNIVDSRSGGGVSKSNDNDFIHVKLPKSGTLGHEDEADIDRASGVHRYFRRIEDSVVMITSSLPISEWKPGFMRNGLSYASLADGTQPVIEAGDLYINLQPYKLGNDVFYRGAVAAEVAPYQSGKSLKSHFDLKRSNLTVSTGTPRKPDVKVLYSDSYGGIISRSFNTMSPAVLPNANWFTVAYQDQRWERVLIKMKNQNAYSVAAVKYGRVVNPTGSCKLSTSGWSHPSCR